MNFPTFRSEKESEKKTRNGKKKRNGIFYFCDILYLFSVVPCLVFGFLVDRLLLWMWTAVRVCIGGSRLCAPYDLYISSLMDASQKIHQPNRNEDENEQKEDEKKMISWAA